jgi:hypothetical protein
VADAKWLVRSSNANFAAGSSSEFPPTVAGYFLPAPLMRFQRSMPPNDPGEALDLFRIAVNGRSQKETRQLAR